MNTTEFTVNFPNWASPRRTCTASLLFHLPNQSYRIMYLRLQPGHDPCGIMQGRNEIIPMLSATVPTSHLSTSIHSQRQDNAPQCPSRPAPRSAMAPATARNRSPIATVMHLGEKPTPRPRNSSNIITFRGCRIRHICSRV